MKFDEGKLRWDLLPMEEIEDVIRVLMHGAEKYSDFNWVDEVRENPSKYYAAAMRHIVAYRKGNTLDVESGLPHLAHAMCCLLFMAWNDNQDIPQRGDRENDIDDDWDLLPPSESGHGLRTALDHDMRGVKEMVEGTKKNITEFEKAFHRPTKADIQAEIDAVKKNNTLDDEVNEIIQRLSDRIDMLDINYKEPEVGGCCGD